jgi:hypothetical protein
MNQANTVFETSPTSVQVSQVNVVPHQEILSQAAPIDQMDKLESSLGSTNFKVEEISSNNRVLLKLDLAKAFDSLSWPFLFEALHQYGFSDHFLEWLAILLSSASTRVLLNGESGPPI